MWGIQKKKHRKRLGNRRQHDLWDKYKSKSNEFIETCREKQLNFGKDIIDKCKDQPELFINM